MTNITMIPTCKLIPHPNNPRKAIKNIEEMVESIKAKGILQNLTVVPYDSAKHGILPEAMDDSYIVLIGNRRLEGSKLAGLPEVPCAVISGLSKKEEMDIMLLENLQREDLTAYEEALSFGFLLESGDSVEVVAKRTGISATKIRTSVKLLKLDPKKLEAANERGATLQDYIELDKISDPDLRNEALEAIGTNNFQYAIKSAIEKENRKKYVLKCVEKIARFAEEIKKEKPGMVLYASYDSYNRGRVKVPEDAATREYFYKVDMTGMYPGVRIFRIQTEADAQEEISKKVAKEAQEKNNAILKDAACRAYELREDFVRNFSSAKAKKFSKEIAAFTNTLLTKELCGYGYCNARINGKVLAGFCNLTLDKSEKPTEASVKDASARAQEYLMLCIGYLMADHRDMNYTLLRWNPDDEICYTYHKENAVLDALYDFLTTLGYELSDEEKSLRDGTHNSFTKDKSTSDSAA